MRVLSNRWRSTLQFYLLRPTIVCLLLLIIALATIVVQEIQHFNIEEPVYTSELSLSLPISPPKAKQPKTFKENNFDYILATPLFHKFRKPFLQHKTVDKTLDMIKLTGVLITQDKSFAIVKDTEENTEKYLAVDAVFGRWRLVQISPQGVKWQSDTGEQFFPLKKTTDVTAQE